jgi:tryptophanyl-tRNA synthetase
MSSYGFLGYPVLQTADIVLYKADYVPVGIDQAPHLELSREIVRRFNKLYKKKVFIEPGGKISDIPKLSGVDGRKMSKTYNNAIFLSDSDKQVSKKVRSMLTDPARARREDPGNPDVCNLYPFHKIYSPKAMQDEIAADCRTAKIGCGDCKKMLSETMLEGMKPMMDKRQDILTRPDEVKEILRAGTLKAHAVAKSTLEQAKQAMKLK